jgi:hypothetical protein
MFDILVAGEINPDLILSGNAVPEFGQVEKLVTAPHLPLALRLSFLRVVRRGWG